MIRAVGLRKRLGDFELRSVSFEAAEGAYAVLLGPTGCGKTVLLETLVGINRPDEGQVWLDGQDVTDVAPERRGIGFVYQRSMLFPHLYGALPVAAVAEVRPYRPGPDGIFTALMPRPTEMADETSSRRRQLLDFRHGTGASAPNVTPAGRQGRRRAGGGASRRLSPPG